MNRTPLSFIGANGIAGQQLNNKYNLQGASITATVVLILGWAKRVDKRSCNNFVQLIKALCLCLTLLTPLR
jgi:hypothetical protein